MSFLSYQSTWHLVKTALYIASLLLSLVGLIITATLSSCMTIILTVMILNYPGLGISPPLAISEAQAQPTLTGVWRGSDGGTYYLRQVGNILWWSGMSADDGRTFNNIFRGTVTSATNTIDGAWMDVPRGNIMGQGELSLKIVSPSTIQKVSQTGSGFGATTWQKIPDAPVVK
jgi:hypothetical protein